MIRFRKVYNLIFIVVLLFQNMVFANTETSFALRSPLASNRSVTESDSREIFEGLNLSYKEAFAIAQKYPHLEMRFMLPAKGDIVQNLLTSIFLV